ncbi:11060_t:CDS:2, partial [Racocetra persica]
MANREQLTSNANPQKVHHNLGMLIQPQQVQARDKLQQNIFDEKRHKKIVSRRRPMENEKERQKAKYESSSTELKNLLAQFGTKAKVADELEKDASKLHSSIESLLEKVQSKTNKLTVDNIMTATRIPTRTHNY